MAYEPRVADGELARKLEYAGAVLVEGAKACGKTETARRVAASEVRLDVDLEARQAVQVAPDVVLTGAVPRLIDEWQVEPAVWNLVRRAVDDRREPGQFVLTGSASPSDDETRHSGAISMRDLLGGKFEPCPDPGITVPDLAEQIARGGWPGTRLLGESAAREAVRDYLDQIRRVDIQSVEGVRRDPEKVGRLMQSLGRNVATHVAVSTLAADVAGSSNGLKPHTASEYLGALDRLFVTENQPAWAPHLRSRHQLRGAGKRHFVDPSLTARRRGEAVPEQRG